MISKFLTQQLNSIGMKTKFLFLVFSFLIFGSINGRNDANGNNINPSVTESGNNTIIKLPVFPEINYTALSDSFSKKRNRYLIIDAHPDHNKRLNNVLMKRKNESTLTKAFALNQNGNLSVLLRNYNPEGEEPFTVTIQQNNYSYEYDVQSLLKKIRERYENDEKPKDSLPVYKANIHQITESSDNDEIAKLVEKELEEAEKAMKKLECLNLNDLARVNAYKKDLQNFYEKNHPYFNDNAKNHYYSIMFWSATCISLTPISMALNDGDETEIWITQKKNETDRKILAGRYRHVGGMSVSVYSNVFLTGLTNNDVYTTEKVITLNDGTTQKELYAALENDQKVSLGVGVNAEVSFRTGHAVRPSWNVGLFVPLETEITPFIATGPGITIRNKNVNLSFGGGVALGQVNQIAGRYRDIDLRQFPDLTSQNLVRKVWDYNWYLRMGVSFNLTGSK
jgi:hypothetical protein